MQNDTEQFAELLKNNPFWSVYDSQFEIVQPASNPELRALPSPDVSLPTTSYVFFAGFFLLGLWCYLRNKI